MLQKRLVLLALAVPLLLPGTSLTAGRLIERPGAIIAQSAAITRDYLVGEWSTRNVEQGRSVEIRWTLWPDGRLAYHFVVDGIASEGSRGTWVFADGMIEEHWHRDNGRIDIGTGAVERIDDTTLRLTIIDNGDPRYQGLVRIYRRVGGPQLSTRQDEATVWATAAIVGL